MLDLLVKKNEYNQIIVLGAALSFNMRSPQKIQEKLQISKSSFNRYLNILNHDLGILFGDSFQLISDGYLFNFINSADIQHNNIFMTTLKYYINQSTTFRILSLLSHHESLKVDDILNELHISYSYFNKLIKKINQYMWHTSVTLIQRNKSLYLEGDEINIIVFKIGLKLALWRFDYDYDPLTNQKKRLVNYRPSPIAHLNTLQTTRLSYIEQTLMDRQQMGESIKIKDEEVRELLVVLMSYKNLIHKDSNLDNQDNVLLLNLMSRIFCPQIDTITDRVALAKLFLAQSTSIGHDTLTLLHFVGDDSLPKISVGSDDYYHYIYQSVLTFIYLRLLRYDFTDLFTIKTDRIASIYTDVPTEFNKLKQDLAHRIPFMSDKNKLIFIQNQERFVSGTYTALRNTKKTTLNLFVDFKYHLSFELYLKKQLTDFFANETIHYLDISEEADLIITDSFMETPSNQEAFVFIDINNHTTISGLISKLTALYTQKLEKN